MFSFSDLWEQMQQFWRSTLKPSWKDLLSEKQNTFNLFFVLAILETLLCILFLSFSNSIAVEAAIELDGKRYSARL